MKVRAIAVVRVVRQAGACSLPEVAWPYQTVFDVGFEALVRVARETFCTVLASLSEI